MRRIDVKASKPAKVKAAAVAELAALKELGPEEIDAWLDENVKSLEDVRRFVKLCIKLLVAEMAEPVR
jgi:post-segregation antitoxin (ccd killing protein)